MLLAAAESVRRAFSEAHHACRRTRFIVESCTGVKQTYAFRIRAFNAIGECQPLITTTITTLPRVPKAPTELAHGRVGISTVELRWTQPPDVTLMDLGHLSDEQMKAAFDKIDLDGGGTLDHHELRVALTDLGKSEREIAELLSGLDKAELCLDEFLLVAGGKLRFQLQQTIEEVGAASDGSAIEDDEVSWTDCTLLSAAAGHLHDRLFAGLEDPLSAGIVGAEAAHSVWTRSHAEETSVVVGCLEPATRYRFRVRALSRVGPSAWCTSAMEVRLLHSGPDPPRDVVLIADKLTAQLVVSWLAPQCAGKHRMAYVVEQQAVGSSDWHAALGTIEGAEELTMRIGGLTPAVKYRFRVRACYGEHRGAMSEAVMCYGSAVAPCTPPLAVVGLHAQSVSSRKATLEWCAPLSEGGNRTTQFFVEKAVLVSGGSWSGILGVPAIKWEAASDAKFSGWSHVAILDCKPDEADSHGVLTRWRLRVSDLQPGRAHLFRVAAATKSGRSPFCEPLQVVTSCEAPAVVTGIECVQVDTSSITLRWKLPADTGGVPLISLSIELRSGDSKVGASDWHSCCAVAPVLNTSLRPPMFELPTTQRIERLLSGCGYKFRIQVNQICDTACLRPSPTGPMPASSPSSQRHLAHKLSPFRCATRQASTRRTLTTVPSFACRLIGRAFQRSLRPWRSACHMHGLRCHHRVTMAASRSLSTNWRL